MIIILLTAFRIAYTIECQCSQFISLMSCRSYKNCRWNGSVCYEPQCSQAQVKRDCLLPECMWTRTGCRPAVSSCSALPSNKYECNQVFGCIANDGFCLPYETCSYTNRDDCNGVTLSGVQCVWNYYTDQCFVFKDCNRLYLDDCQFKQECVPINKACRSVQEVGCDHFKNEKDCAAYEGYQCQFKNNKCVKIDCSTLNQQGNCLQQGCNWIEGNSCVLCDQFSQFIPLFMIFMLFIQ